MRHQLDGGFDSVDLLRDLIREGLRKNSTTPKRVVIADAVDQLIDQIGDAGPDWRRLAQASAHGLYTQLAPAVQRSRGEKTFLERRRATEVAHRNGERVDVPPMELTIFEAHEAAARRIQSGNATLQQGSMWMLIVNTALATAARADLPLGETRLCDVLSDSQVEAIVGESRAA